MREDSLEITMVFDSFQYIRTTLDVQQDKHVNLPDSTVKAIESSTGKWKFTYDSSDHFQWRQVEVSYCYPSDSLFCRKNQVACVLMETDTLDKSYYDDKDKGRLNEIYEVFDVTEMAKFRNGSDDLMEFIESNIELPQELLEICFTASVTVKFVIEKNGILSQIEVLGTKLTGFGLEEEAIRVISLTNGMWEPAKIQDVNVRMVYRVPIKFGIYDE